MSEISLLTLPIEILHRVLDDLDVQTIFLALGNVCEQFRTIVLNYKLYKLDFTTISKADFHRIRRFIRPKNVLSITLSDGEITPGQILLFLSLFRINRFTQLRSLTLLNIGRHDLNTFLGFTMKYPLISMTIHTRIEINHSWYLNILNLSPILSQPYLRSLDMNIWSRDIEQLQWPVECTIENLKVVHLNSKQICTILCHCSNLRTFVLKYCVMKDLNGILTEISCLVTSRNLTSLVLEHNELDMNKLELMLSFIPSLTHLRIIDDITFPDLIFDGSYWERLIESKLPVLKRFEFFIRTMTNIDHQSFDIKSLILPFQTSFWREEKRWFINCDYIMYLHRIILYSLPICQTSLQYVSNSEKISYSNFTTLEDNDLMTMDNIHRLYLNLNQLIITEKDQSIQKSLFRNVRELDLRTDDKWPIDAHLLLSTLIDLSRLEKISLNVNFTHESTSNTITSIRQLLEHTPYVRSLSVSHYWSDNHYTTTMENVCFMVTSNITHLEVKVENVDEMKIIIEKLKQLSSVTFACVVRRISSDKFIEWLTTKGKRPTYWNSDFFLHIWLDKYHSMLT